MFSLWIMVLPNMGGTAIFCLSLYQGKCDMWIISNYTSTNWRIYMFAFACPIYSINRFFLSMLQTAWSLGQKRTLHLAFICEFCPEKCGCHFWQSLCFPPACHFITFQWSLLLMDWVILFEMQLLYMLEYILGSHKGNRILMFSHVVD